MKWAEYSIHIGVVRNTTFWLKTLKRGQRRRPVNRWYGNIEID
jgi:hypothetical protein